MFLNCHTAFSFKYGTLQVKDLFEEARRCGVHKLILTDINNTASYIEMLRYCEEQRPTVDKLTPSGEEGYSLDIAVGIEFRKDHELLYIAIAKNNVGFEKLNRFLSHHNLQNRSLPVRAPALEEVFIIYPFRQIDPELLRENEFIGIRGQDLNHLPFYASYKDFPDKFVVWHPVTFASKNDFNTHRLLRAIDNNTLLSKLSENQQASPDEIMIPEHELKLMFKRYPALIRNAMHILDSSSIFFEMRTDKNMKQMTGSEKADWAMLIAKTWEGFESRYGERSAILTERIERELDIIKTKGFCSYYLIAYDLITFANKNRYAYVGRGSGANR